MHKLTQTHLHEPEKGIGGNCFETALAGILHIPIEDIPVFPDTLTWRREVNAFLRQFNLAYIPLSEESGLADWFQEISIEGLHCICAGSTNRSKDVSHACIGIDGRVAWDPHPSRDGLTGIETTGVLVALRPWEQVEARELRKWMPKTAEHTTADTNKIDAGNPITTNNVDNIEENP